MEADLRALDDGFDVSEVTMRRLCRELAVVRRPMDSSEGARSDLRRFTTLWRWVAGLAAIAALWMVAALIGLSLENTSAPQITLVRHGEGQVEIERGGMRLSVESLEPLLAGDVIHAQAHASITYADGTRVDFGPGTHIALPDRTDEAKSLTMHTGRLSADVAKQPAGRPMLFHTPQAVATVLGTQLDLAIQPSVTRLSVTEGHVRLMRRNDSATVEVSAGHVAYAGAAMELAARPPRIAEGLIALYRFDEGAGTVVHDRSGLSPALPLTLKTSRKDAAVWLPEGGLRLDHRAILVSEGPAAKVIDAVRASNALTLEAWIVPALEKQRGTGPRHHAVERQPENQFHTGARRG